MKRSTSTVLLLILAGVAGADATINNKTQVFGTVACKLDRSGDLCRIAWEIPASARKFYWMEEMEPEQSSWHRLFRLPTRAGITESKLQGGRLYRVIACEDAAGTQSCSSSQVVWAPFQALNVDSIPDVVHTKQGEKMLVGKRNGLQSQNQQYNLYLLVRLMSGADGWTMPPMRPSRFPLGTTTAMLSAAKATSDDALELFVYGEYEAWRTSKKPDRQSTGGR
jgi:hypothetical protein